MSNKLYKSTDPSLYQVFKRIGKETYSEVPTHEVLELLRTDLYIYRDLTQFTLENDKNLLKDIEEFKNGFSPAKIGELLGLNTKGIIDWKSGSSRFENIYRHKVISEASSWNERIKAVNGTTDKYVSDGWSRTMNANYPTSAPKINTSAADQQYIKILNNPLQDNQVIMEMVINGSWYLLLFRYDFSRFHDAKKLCLPEITINEYNKIEFSFSVEYEYEYREISDRYITAVDVGKTVYATVVVWDTHLECIVHASTLSKRSRLLYKSACATQSQVTALTKKLDKPGIWFTDYMRIREEISKQRSALSRKRRELAIITAQEIADIAYQWGNTIVAVEDLSWVSNTMQNGRWNRGELVSWITHYVEFNGSRVIKVNPAYTSQCCHACDNHGSLNSKTRLFSCACGVRLDRDVNAAANIAKRATSVVTKSVATRKKAKKYAEHSKRKNRRTPVTRDVLVRGSSRTVGKGRATGKSDSKKRGRLLRASRSRFGEEVLVSNTLGTVTSAECSTVMMDPQQSKCWVKDPRKATINDYSLCVVKE